MKKFPDGFLWGSATSAHQVEGGNHNDWTEWEKKNAERLSRESGKKYPSENYISGQAADHYHRYEEDFNIAQSLGQNAHRFSIEWSRIEPEEGKFNEEEIDHYRKVIRALRQRRLEPFVSLYHWTLPLWIRDSGGWENEKTTRYFVRYVEKVTSALPGVKFWITLNEPMVYASHSYFKGNWPPQKKSIVVYLRVISNLICAHRSAYAALKSIRPFAQVGIAKNNIDFGGRFRPGAHWWWNRRFLDKIRDYQDFIGLNYYFGQCRSKEKSDLGWSICPEGIYRVLKDLRRYQKPVYITENGIADARDVYREKFIKEHLKWVQQAIQEGVDIRGYLYWSLLDNFEWSEGFWPRFGLVEVDYKTMRRTIRLSARAYAEICESNTLYAKRQGGAAS